MKSSTKRWLKIFGPIVVVFSVPFLCVIFYKAFICLFFWYACVGFDHQMNVQVAAGRKYMDSLTEKDIPVWVNRTKKYLDQYDPQVSIIHAKPVPPELKQLNIVGINEGSNWVAYVWMGGLNHTELRVEHMADGEFQFTAWYNDESNRVIWPK